MCAALALACAGALLLAQAPRALAAGPCVGKVMYFAAHQDDTLLFQSPALLEDIQANKCVQTVFLTAGDAGRPASYWEGRELGAEVAYAQMAGVASSWTHSEPTFEGHKLHVENLDGQPGVSIVSMRLPDGGIEGEGFPAYGNQSLEKLWHGGHAEVPAISSIKAVDNSTTYTYQGLIDTLAAQINSFDPERIETQNYTVPFNSADHPDHVGTGKFVKLAQLAYPEPHLLMPYEDYETAAKAQNVEGSLLTAKSNAFYAYGAHDDEACASEITCAPTEYAKWLKREYKIAAAAESTPGADAGPDQNVASGASVQLDGSGSFDPGNGGLTYSWTKTSGPAVVLSDPTAEKPTFTAPTGPATLKFSLVVDNGPRESLPASVTVTVAKPNAAPNFSSVDFTSFETGVFGSFTITTTGTPTPAITKTSGTVPPGLTLVDQGDGTAVLSGIPDASAAPPGGSQEWPIGLKAENSVGPKAQTLKVTISNPGTAPQFTSANTTSFTVGETKAFTITTSGEPAATITRTSAANTVPPGLTLVDQGDGTAVLSGKPEQSAAPPGGSKKYEIILKADNGVGSDPQQTLSVTVSNVDTVPKFESGTSAAFTVGVAGTFTITTSGAPDPAITKTAGSLPPGLKLTDKGDGTATISGTPEAAAADPGTTRPYPLTLKAKNVAGEDSQELTLSVTSPPSPPPDNGGGGGGGGNQPPPPPPPKENIVVKLSKAKVKLVLGKASKHLIKVIAPGKSAVRCRGQLPKGARCRVNAQGNVVIESSKSVTRAGTFHLVVGFAYQAGSSQRPLTVVFKRPER